MKTLVALIAAVLLASCTGGDKGDDYPVVGDNVFGGVLSSSVAGAGGGEGVDAGQPPPGRDAAVNPDAVGFDGGFPIGSGSAP